MGRVLSQKEVDAVFQNGVESGSDTSEAASFDFGRLDRIPKSQLRALHLVHENFVRNLSSNLSAYLRSYVVVNLVSLEQVSYSEFLDAVASPTCIAYLDLKPYDGTAILEMNMALTFGLMELLLGSKGRSPLTVQRKITDIEKNLIKTLMRVILRDLGEAWKSVANISFGVQSLASEPQLLHVLAPAEAVIVIAIEVRVGSTSGLMNLAVPSIFVKRLRARFEELQQVRRAESTERDQSHLGSLIQHAKLMFEAQIDGGSISTSTLFDLEIDDVLVLDHSLNTPVNGFLNGHEKWLGAMTSRGDKLVFQLDEVRGPKPKLLT